MSFSASSFGEKGRSSSLVVGKDAEQREGDDEMKQRKINMKRDRDMVLRNLDGDDAMCFVFKMRGNGCEFILLACYLCKLLWSLKCNGKRLSVTGLTVPIAFLKKLHHY